MTPANVVKATLLLGFGVFMMCFGVGIFASFPKILQWQVEENLVLSPDAEPYEYWRVVPVPIYCKFYFFNITNAADVLKNNSKPHLQELGPYTFRESREKVNIKWHDNGTVSYQQVKRWFFDSNATVGSLDDLVTTINVPMVTAANRARITNDDDFMQAVEGLLLQLNSEVFVTRTVQDLLFDGYREEILVITKHMGLPVPYEKFGWFYPKNNSEDGEYTIFTGKNSVDNYGYVEKFNGQSFIQGRTPPCNTIAGTAGDMWPPYRKTMKQKLELFIPDICSSLDLHYLESIQVNEIESYRYWLDNNSFDNGHYDNGSRCYCKGSCMPSGALDIEECQHGAPALVSFPHFLYADTGYGQHFTGLKPNPEKHRFIIDLEPQLGIPINVEARMQINVAIPKIDSMQQFSFPEKTIYYPIFWFSETASMNLETAEKLKFVTRSLPQYVTLGCFASVIIAGVLICSGLHVACERIRKDPRYRLSYRTVHTMQS